MNLINGITGIVKGADSIIGKFLPDKTKARELSAELIKFIENNITARHKLDMMSDSWLSKNIRPLCLIWCIVMNTAMLILSCAGLKVPAEMWQTMAICSPMIFGFYFASRGIEKMKK